MICISRCEEGFVCLGDNSVCDSTFFCIVVLIGCGRGKIAFGRGVWHCVRIFGEKESAGFRRINMELIVTGNWPFFDQMGVCTRVVHRTRNNFRSGGDKFASDRWVLVAGFLLVRCFLPWLPQSGTSEPISRRFFTKSGHKSDGVGFGYWRSRQARIFRRLVFERLLFQFSQHEVWVERELATPTALVGRKAESDSFFVWVRFFFAIVCGYCFLRFCVLPTWSETE